MTKLDQLLNELFDDAASTLDDDRLFASMEGWDSLKHVEFIVAIESRYAVDLAADEIARLTSRRAARAVLSGRGLHD